MPLIASVVAEHTLGEGNALLQYPSESQRGQRQSILSCDDSLAMEIPYAKAVRVLSAVAIALTLAYRGRKRKSLSASGAVAAFAVGFLSWAVSVRFGLTLIVFYLASTGATRFGAEKKKLVEDSDGNPNGNRNAHQVLASSAPAVLVALIYAVVHGDDAPLCKSQYSQSTLLLMYMFFFASCAGDTFSSELGLVFPKRQSYPFLITNPWKRVPPGTNGGVTWQGTMGSLFGGFIIGLTFLLSGPRISLDQFWLLVLGTGGGFVGSVMDSVLGATFQLSVLDLETGKVKSQLPSAVSTTSQTLQYICGRNMLSGESVNLLASVLVMIAAPFAVTLFDSVSV